MNIPSLHLVASFKDGSYYSHPICDESSLLRVYTWLSPITPKDAEWSVSEEGKR